MDKSGKRARKPNGSSAPQPRAPQAVDLVAMQGDKTTTSPDALDPLEFFRPKNREGDVSRYAKQRAEAGEAPSIIRAWARAARVETTPWALLPIAIVAALSWSLTNVAHLDRLFILAVGTLAALAGTHLLRQVAREVSTPSQLIAVLSASRSARVSGALYIIACVVGAIIGHWVGGGGLALGIAGLALALLYGCLPALVGTFPGEEVIPAVALGPLLFFLALATQQTPATAKTPHPPSVTLGTAWLLALAIGCLIFALVIAARLHAPEPTNGLATRVLLGLRGLRALYALAIALAYLLVAFASFGAQAPHAAIAVLLSAPIAVIPLTGIARGQDASALRVIQPQTERLLLWFEGWLLAGLLLAGLYLHVITAFHALVNGK